MTNDWHLIVWDKNLLNNSDQKKNIICGNIIYLERSSLSVSTVEPLLRQVKVFWIKTKKDNSDVKGL